MAVESLQILVLKFKPMVPNRWAMAHRCFFGRPWRHCAFWYVQIHWVMVRSTTREPETSLTTQRR